MNKKTRINKWRNYREEIDTNENIHYSIVNSNKEIKDLFESIDFNIENAYKKSGFRVEKKSSTKKEKNNIKVNIEELLSIIEKTENTRTKNKMDKDFSSHKNDHIINEYFLEFIDKDEIEEQKNQETTDLKINKINIVDNKEK